MKWKQLQTKFETYLLTQKRSSFNTFQSYKSDIAQFVFFMHKKMHEDSSLLQAEDIKQFIYYLYDLNLKPQTIARKIASLKSFFSHVSQEYAIPNYTKDIYAPKMEKRLPKFMTEEEMEALFHALESDTSPLGLRNKLIVYLLYASGMRVSELAFLRVTDVMVSEGIIIIQGKGDKQRSIPIPQEIMQMLDAHIKQVYKDKKIDKKDAYIFSITYGNKIKPISRQSLWIIVKKIWKKAGIRRHLSPHILRHTLATHMLKQGIDLRSLQLILGHEQLATVQLYTHLENKQVRKVYNTKHPRS